MNAVTSSAVDQSYQFPAQAATYDAAEAQVAPPYAYPYAVREPGRFSRFFTMVNERAPWAAPAGVALLIGGGVAYTLLMDPTRASATSTPTCILRLLTGFDCPGCGGTRAAWYMMHGNLSAAARHHAPLLFATPFLAYMYVAWAAKTVFRRAIVPLFQPSNITVFVFLGLWLAFSIARNLPWEPFNWFWV